jgi:hypothetical protein
MKEKTVRGVLRAGVILCALEAVLYLINDVFMAFWMHFQGSAFLRWWFSSWLYAPFSMRLFDVLLLPALATLLFGLLHPQTRRRRAVLRGDERNVRLREKAASISFYVNAAALAALVLWSRFYAHSDRWHLIAIGLLFLHIGSFYGFHWLFGKKM